MKHTETPRLQRAAGAQAAALYIEISHIREAVPLARSRGQRSVSYPGAQIRMATRPASLASAETRRCLKFNFLTFFFKYFF